MTYTVENPSESKIIFTITVPYEEYAKRVEKTVRELGGRISIPGFRPGKAPYDIVKQRLGEQEILKEAFPSIAHDSYLNALHEHGAQPALPPKITVSRLILGQPIEYAAEVVLTPTITLPEFSEISVEKKAVAVSPDAVSKLLEELRKMRAQGGELPELNDAFARELNNEFVDLAVLKAHLAKNLRAEEEERERDRMERDMIEKIINKSVFSEIAKELIIQAQNELFSEIKHSVSRYGARFDEYLSRIKKTEEALHDELKSEAEKRIKFSTLINKVIRDERMEISEEEITGEANKFLRQFRSVKEAKRAVDPQTLVRGLQETLLRRKAVSFLKEKIRII